MISLSGLIGFCKTTWNKFLKNRSIKAEDYIEPQVIVYRAVTKNTWWDGDKPKHDIFLRELDEEDLSILTEAGCHPEYCAAIRMKNCRGEVGLAADSFIKRGFKVVRTPEPYDPVNNQPPVPHHASVYGMPSENEAIARSIAFELLEEIVYMEKRKYNRDKIKKKQV